MTSFGPCSCSFIKPRSWQKRLKKKLKQSEYFKPALFLRGKSGIARWRFCRQRRPPSRHREYKPVFSVRTRITSFAKVPALSLVLHLLPGRFCRVSSPWHLLAISEYASFFILSHSKGDHSRLRDRAFPWPASLPKSRLAYWSPPAFRRFFQSAR